MFAPNRGELKRGAMRKSKVAIEIWEKAMEKDAREFFR